MSSKFFIGLAVVAVLIAAVFYKQRGDHLAPDGSILKVRSVPADEQHTIAVLNLRIKNDSDVAMEVRDVSVVVEMKDGREVEGNLIAKADSKQVFQYYPALGEAYNEAILRGSRIGAHQTADFMLACRLDLTETQLTERRKMSVLVQDRSMLKLTLLEKHR